jgi:hypothetical protein
MNNADFRIKATAPDAPSSTGIAVLYTNGSGVLMTRLQNGESFQVGSRIYASGHPSATLITYSSAGVYGNAGTFTYTGHELAAKHGVSQVNNRFLEFLSAR